jgi:hypothetical protein
MMAPLTENLATMPYETVLQWWEFGKAVNGQPPCST